MSVRNEDAFHIRYQEGKKGRREKGRREKGRRESLFISASIFYDFYKVKIEVTVNGNYKLSFRCDIYEA